MQDQYGVDTGVGYEPPCAPKTPLVLLPRCPELWQRAELDNEVPPTAWDSVQLMGLRLVRIARAVDGVGRDLGALPLNLRPVPSYSSISMKDIGDIWHHAVRYLPRGRAFEVRSAGADGALDTADDIVVSSSLGETIPCAFRTGRGTVTCSEPPPPCPAAAANASPPTSLGFVSVARELTS
jgi:hypothetical protein